MVRIPGPGYPCHQSPHRLRAKTSSIHAFNIQKFRRNGETWVSSEVHPLQNNRRTVIRCEKPVIDKRSVKSSSGIAEIRYVIVTVLQMGDQAWEIELTLANRDSMGYRMLLRREAINGRIIVDPSHSFLLGHVSSAQTDDYYGDKKKTRTGLIGLLASRPGTL